MISLLGEGPFNVYSFTGGPLITDHSEAKTLTDKPDTELNARSKPIRVRRIGLIAVISIAVPVAVLSLLVFITLGRPLTAPTAVSERIEDILTARLPGFDVELGEVSLILQENFVLRIRARNVELIAPDGSGTVELSQIDANFNFATIAKGQVAPIEIRISGVFLDVLRQSDGTLNVSVGSGKASGPVDAAIVLSTLGEQVERFLERPLLAQLDRFELEDMTLRFEDARVGQGWTVDGGQLRLERQGIDVTISTQLSLLGGQDYATNFNGYLNTSFETLETQFGVSFEDMPAEGLANQTAALSWLKIVRAALSGSLSGETNADGELGPLIAELNVDDGLLQPDDTVRPVPFENLRTFFTYYPDREAIFFDELSLDSALVRVTASGQALMRDIKLGLPKELLVQLEMSRFEANPKELKHAPLALNRSFADFRLKLNPFELTLGQMVINHGVHQMRLAGEISTQGTSWEYAVDGHSDGLDVNRILSIWPNELKPNLRKWVNENIHTVKLHDINFAIRSKAEEKPDVYVDFQFSDAEVKVLKTMPPVRQASGYASLIRNQFRVAAESGKVSADLGGEVDLSGTGFIVQNTLLKQSPAFALVKATGSITAIVSLLDREPLKVFSKANLPVEIATGRADLVGTAKFLMKENLPAGEVKYDVSGELADARTSYFIKGKEIRADLVVHASNERVELKGNGTVGVLPFDGKWYVLLSKQNKGESRLVGSAELSQRTIEEFNIGLPDGTVSGQGQANFEIAFAGKEPPRMTLESDLVGVGLSSEPLGWRKKFDKSGELEMVITLTEPPSIDNLSINAGNLKMSGDIDLSEEGGLDVMRMTSFEVDRWLKGAGELRGRGLNQPPLIVVSSGTFDMRYQPRLTTGRESGGASQPVSAKLERVQVTDNLYLTNVEANLQTGAGVSGEFNGTFLGVAPLSGLLTPHRHGTALKVTSKRGGAMAAAMGVVNAATRGALEMTLIPRKTTGVYDGELAIKDIKVQKIPLIAELLNAISVIGLIEQLNGPGLLFTDVYSRFRLTPQKLVVAEGSAVGPSLGISADGTYQFAGKLFDFQGAISPIYALNVIGRAISRRGEGLIGFNYTLRGPSSDPKISINPLSALAPGFFREIFRRPPPQLNN
ncbi:hypothetical protein [Pseudopelagicola sp. nBUS_19]|uniref:hypothetical protein n=1 Tax=Pseudopelagicola sp. nBUS_19 TaxID=3395316 RepID=UPI003EBE3055